MKIGSLGKEKEIKNPKELNLDYKEISKSDRTASGRKVKDIIVIKRIFNLTYNGLFPNDMRIFTSLYKRGKAVNFIYEDENGTQSAFVEIVSIPRELYIPKPKLSKNITITLEEV